MQEITHEDYSLNYNSDTGTVVCTGSFRLRGPDYAPILKMLNDAAGAGHGAIVLDLRDLQFLNSSGINTLSKFVIGMRKRPDSQLVIQGSADYPWQKKSLGNFQKLLPSITIEM